jgi:VCBS repeat-containing protein
MGPFAFLGGFSYVQSVADNITDVSFNIYFAANNIEGYKIIGAALDLQYDYALVYYAETTNPTFTYKIGTKTIEAKVWASETLNLSLADDPDPVGAIQLVAQYTGAPATYDPITVNANGLVYSVTLSVDGLVDQASFPVVLQSTADGGDNYIVVDDGPLTQSSKRYDMDGGILFPPSLTMFDGVIATIGENAQQAITFDDLAAKGDESDYDGQVVGFVVKSVTTGTLKIGADAATATAYDASTNNTIDATHIAFWTPAQGAGGTLNAFKVVAIDNYSFESTPSVQVTMLVSSVNDAPVLNVSATPVVTGIAEDVSASSNTGTTIGAMLVDGSITDADGTAVEAVYVTAVDNAHGSWEYKAGSGSWTAFDFSGNAGKGLLLDAADSVRFVPAENWNGTSTITFGAWDKSGGSVAGSYADISTKGGAGEFSTATDTASITVSAVNDAPTNTVPAAQTLAEDGTLVLSSANSNAITVGDLLDTAQGNSTDGLTVTASVLHGTLTATIGGGATITSNGSSSVTISGTAAQVNAALFGLTYAPILNYNGSDTLTIVTSDSGNTGTGGSLSDTDTVSITISPVNDAPTNITLSASTIQENVAVGSGVEIGTLTVTDPDVSGNSNVLSLEGADASSFKIESGKLYFTGTSPNYEARQSYAVTVKSTDGALTFSKAFTVNVTDVNEFDVTSPTDSNASANTVAENAASGVTVGVTASAIDADGSNHTVTYSLVGDAQGNAYTAGEFTIDPTTGVVKTGSTALDYESGATRTVYVKATSSDGSSAITGFTVNVTDVDEFDVTSPTDSNASANTVEENTASGVTVGVTASASDADGTNSTVTYSLVGDAQGSAYTAGEFTIDPTTGVVKTGSTALNYESGSTRTVYVKATSSDGSNAITGFTVNVTDVDEFDVTSPTDSNASANTVAENTAVGVTVGITASASDADGTNNTVTYSLVGDAQGRAYTAGEFTIDPTTGVVKTGSTALDYESGSTRTVYVKATSSDGSSAIKDFTVNVTDVSEFDVTSPTDSNASSNTVAENTAAGVTVGVTASAIDADGTNHTVTYSLVGDAQGNAYTAGEFTIDPTTGVVKTGSTALNYESGATRTVYVKATSSDGSSSITGFTVNVTDVNEFDVTTPTDSNASANTVAENVAAGVTVGVTASASDADGTNNTVSYSLVGDAQGNVYMAGEFTIDPTTGVLRTGSTGLNYESGSTRTVYVKATSSDGSSAIKDFTVNVTDVSEFDVTSPTDSNASSNTVAENTAVGVTVGITASASDADGTNNTVTYSLLGDAQGNAYTAGEFAVDPTTGVVRTGSTALDYESGSSRTVYVKATSSDGSSAVTGFTVNVTDVNEFDVTSPTDSNASANTVEENAASGVTVGVTASASDADGTNSTVTYSLVGDAQGNAYRAGEFTIDSTTGVVKTGSTALNYESGATRTVYVNATSSDGSSAITGFTVNVTNVNETPSAGNSTAMVTVDRSRTLSAGDFKFSDVDAGDSLASVKITALPLKGLLKYNEGSAESPSLKSVTVNQVISKSDIDAGKLVYIPDAATNYLDYGTSTSDASFTFTVTDAGGLESGTATLTIDLVDNALPTLTTFSGAIATINEDTQKAITFADLAAKGDEFDQDGTVDGFVVKAVSTGTLKIGADAASATAYNASTNKTIDATHIAFWTPAQDANGQLNAFTVVALDDLGGESASATQVTMQVTPINDAPVINEAGSGLTGALTENRDTDAVTAGVQMVATGTVAFSDVDAGDTVAATVTASAATLAYRADGAQSDSQLPSGLDATALKGAFSITTGGEWTYNATALDLEKLGSGDKVTLTYTVTVTDGDGLTDTAPVTITLTGANDAPVINEAGSGLAGALTENRDTDAVTEGVQMVATGTVVSSDVDAGDTVAATVTASAATLAYRADGAQSDSQLPSGLDATALKGAFSITTGGEWTYNATALDLEKLGSGDKVTLTYTVTVTDGDGLTDTAPVTITLTGANDAPVINEAGSVLTGALTENTDTDAVTAGVQMVATGTVAFSDVDAGDTVAATVTASAATLTYRADGAQSDSQLPSGLDAAALKGAFSITTGGEWTYNATALDLEKLGSGDKVTLTYTVTVTDGDGLTDTAPVTITLTGANDAPVINEAGSVLTGALTENTDTDAVSGGVQMVATGTVAFSDVDAGDTVAATVTASAATLAYRADGAQGDSQLPSGLDATALKGAFSITTGGEWTYNATALNLEKLGLGDTVTLIYTVTVTDGDGLTDTAPVTITLTGANDAPTVVTVIPDQKDAVEDVPYSFTFNAGTFADVDSGDSLSYTATLENGTALPTWLTFDAASRTFSGTPGDAGVGSINVKVTATDGSNASVSDVFRLSVANVNDAPKGSVTITGTAKQGETLTADTSGLSDADGLGRFTYRWYADGKYIGVGESFTLDEAQVGKSMTVKVSYTDGHGTLESKTSAATSQVENVNDLPTGAVIVEGTVSKGSVLTADISTLADADGLPQNAEDFAYQWQSYDGTTWSDISGANASTYTLKQTDVGDRIRVNVNYTDGHDMHESVTSAQTATVTNVNSAPTGEPLITGKTYQGEKLTAVTTGIADADGLGQFSYQWYAGNAAINGATGSTYSLTSAEVGKTITVAVGYTDGQGTHESLHSSPTVAVYRLSIGTVVDGYLANALVWIDEDNDGVRDWTDLNNNGKWNPGEGESWDLTDATGQYTLTEPLNNDTWTIRMTAEPGGSTYDISTGAKFTGTYSAPTGSTVVNPLTTLIVANSVANNLTAVQSESQVKELLGLDPILDLKTYDPLLEAVKASADANANKATAVKVYSAAIQVANLIDVATSMVSGAGVADTSGVAGEVATALLTASQSGGVLDLTNAAVISETLSTVVDKTVADSVKADQIKANLDTVATAEALVNHEIQAVADNVDPLQTVLVEDELTKIVTAQIVASNVAGEASGASTGDVTVSVTADNIGTKLTDAGADVQTVLTNYLPIGEVLIAGTPKEAATLTASNTLFDVDGLGTISYQWQAAGVDINGAHGNSYTLTHAEAGKAITVVATYIDGDGKHEMVISDPTSSVLDEIAPVVTGLTPGEGETGVPVGSDIILTFSETIQKGTGLIEILIGSATGDVVESYNAATDSTHLSISGNTLRINPSLDLANSTKYYVKLADGVVKDIYGNFFDANEAAEPYGFTTAAAVAMSSHGDSGDIVLPVLVGVTTVSLISWLVF